MKIVELREEHLDDAARLGASRYRALREAVPQLSDRFCQPDAILAHLQDLGGATGVAALRGGRLVGYLQSIVIRFRGRRAAFSPEWGNGAQREHSAAIYRHLYATLSRAWVADGCTGQVVMQMAHDHEAREAWHWLGFGLAVADGVRGLEPLVPRPPHIVLRRGSVGDAEQITKLNGALGQHMAAPPIWLPHPGSDQQELRASLADEATAWWLAADGDRIAGYMKFGPASTNASDVILDEDTCSNTGAYTLPEVRRSGIGAALLDRGLGWAREEGYARCAVDFETMNIPGAGFWMKHFRPVCFGLHRVVAETG